MDDLDQLEGWAGPLLAKLQPDARRTLARTIGTELRRSQQQRIAEQRNPDGSAYAPRKRSKGLRDKRGRIKRSVMFAKLRTSRWLRMTTNPNAIAVGFVGRVARIARVHQEGLTDKVNSEGTLARYARRELLGFTEADRKRIRDRLIDHLGA